MTLVALDNGGVGVDRLAVIAYHSSPLGSPGAGDAGGMTVYVRELARALTTRGVRTDIFTRATDTAAQVTDVSPGVRVVSVGAGPLSEIPKRELTRYIDEFSRGVCTFARATGARYDIVHSHYWQSGLAGMGLAARWGVPLVHSHHTLARVKNRFLPPGDAPEPLDRIRGEEAVMAAADVLVASTDEEWEQMSCLYGVPHDRLKTLPPGVNHGTFFAGDRQAARSELGLGDEAVMLYVGRIQSLKGLDLAIRAADELVPALDRELVFLIVGGPSGNEGNAELQRLRDLVAARDLHRHVRFVGAQSHHRLPVYYRAADVVVACSYSESFGLAALEAQACGTPVVATAVGGLADIVQDGRSGFLVDARDPTAFAARLKVLLSDADLLAQFRTAALKSAAGFSWDQTARSLLELYECLVTHQFPEACTC